MVNYDDIPLFPLHVVLFPDMPLPLHIFEPRYREMILRCREEKSPFGITLIQSGADIGAEAVPRQVGTIARIAQYEEMPDGRMNIVVFGETRFRINQTFHDKPYLSASVHLFQEEAAYTFQLQPVYDAVATLFRTYLQSLFAMSGRTLSTLQLPQEPEFLSYAVASVLQIPAHEKQILLEMTDTHQRLEREIEILSLEIEAQDTLQAVVGGLSLPVDTQELGKMASLN
ncbi:MAG: LON peptidase substrate-binding domain-containing protein [Janthinobacterium lividum]